MPSFNTNRWNRIDGEDPIELVTPCHYAQVMRIYLGLKPLGLTVLAEERNDCATVPQHLAEPRVLWKNADEMFLEH